MEYVDYEKLHKDTIAKLQEMVNSGKITVKTACGICADFVPESEDERIRKAIIKHFEKERKESRKVNYYGVDVFDILAWLEKQGEKKPTQEIEPFEAEHGKYYYCIKDYFCGGKKQASKGNVVQALRGLPIMGLKDASEYFLPVNYIKCNFAWSEEDKEKLNRIYMLLPQCIDCHPRIIGDKECVELQDWLKSLKDRVQPQLKQEWSKEDESLRLRTIGALETCKIGSPTKCVDEQINWLKSLTLQSQWKPSEEQIVALKHASNDCSIAFADMKILATLYEQLKALHHYEQDT